MMDCMDGAAKDVPYLDRGRTIGLEALGHRCKAVKTRLAQIERDKIWENQKHYLKGR